MCHEPLDDPNLKGISRYLNSSTIRGRANVAKLTFACFFGAYIINKLRPREKTAIEEGKSLQTVGSNLNSTSYQEMNKTTEQLEETSEDPLVSTVFSVGLNEPCSGLNLKNKYNLAPLPSDYPLRDYTILLNSD